MYFNPQDHYFKKAKQQWFKARSAFKLEEIDQKYRIFDKQVKTVMDIGCAPGSWLQYVHEKVSGTGSKSASKMHPSQRDGKALSNASVSLDNKQSVKAGNAWPILIWFDIKDVDLNLPGVYTYNQDIQDTEKVRELIWTHGIEQFDVIMSDMAPNTIGFRDIDAMRSIELLRMTLPLYEHFLKPDWKAVIKIFMWPGFEEFIADFKKIVGSKNVKTFKPQAVRKESKEIYIVKF